jgi:hypothetical protein
MEATMLTRIRKLRHRALTLTLGLELALVLVGFGLHDAISAARAEATTAEADPGAVQLGTTFAGVGAEGVDMIWSGALRGAITGEVTIRVEYIGAEMDRNRPVWPVRAIVFAATDDAAKSSAGHLGGRLNWQTGDLRLNGRVTDGWRRNAHIEQTLSLDRERLDGTGTIRFVDVTAER